MSAATYLLTLSCPNRPGIVSAVSTYLFQHGCNILDAQQFDDTQTNLFFMRVLFNRVEGESALPELRDGFAAIAMSFAMQWTMRDRAQKKRVMLLVSKFDHCLADLLYRWRMGELAMEVTAIVANYARGPMPISISPGHLPPSADHARNEARAETELWRLVRETNSELVVLARYMQVLSDGLTAKLAGRCINIHHSFCPASRAPSPITKPSSAASS